jgi:RimJ/RimL family protein N-acetyltransferase
VEDANELGRWAKPVLGGERVTLRPMTAADADMLWELVNDPTGNDLTATTADFTRERIDDWAATRAACCERLDLVIVDNATGEAAGEVVLNEYDPADDSCNFRIALRGPAWFGRGLGGEATQLIIAHGLGPVGLRRITLSVLRRNPRAIRAYERAGFNATGERHEDGEDWVAMAVERAPFTPS